MILSADARLYTKQFAYAFVQRILLDMRAHTRTQTVTGTGPVEGGLSTIQHSIEK